MKVKLIVIPQHILGSMLIDGSQGPTTVLWPVISGIPKDIKLTTAYHDEGRREFVCYAYSDEFPDIPAGETIPVLNDPRMFQIASIIPIGVMIGAHLGGATKVQLLAARDLINKKLIEAEHAEKGEG
jgi:hypothetical protein